MPIQTILWSYLAENQHVFCNDELFTSLEEALETVLHEDEDDHPECYIGVIMGHKIPCSLQLLEDRDEQCGTDVDGNGPNSDEHVPKALMDALDLAIKAVNEALPEWYEAATPIDLTGYPW